MITTINTWRSPASEYPRRRVGSARIATAWYASGMYACYGVNGWDYYSASRRLYITILKIDGKTWMVDDPPHWWAMQKHAELLRGHVVCAGLGLGLIVHALDANPRVSCITVVERSQDVIDLVGPLVPQDKLNIIHADWFSFDPTSIAPADGVLFDLFVSNDGRSLLDEGFNVAADIYRRWDNLTLTVRVHGLPNPLIGEVGRVLVLTEREIATKVIG